jgi:hypothetical protein
VTVFGAACCACPAAALACAAALLAASLDHHRAGTQQLSAALGGTAIGALLLALFSALLQLLASEPQEPRSRQRSERSKQVSCGVQSHQISGCTGSVMIPGVA